ncbi:SAM-dependent methyltransferase [Prosthecochloris sp. N3]|uniref:SAM-dependent methyltransferase n=1 Tax=Prosthecochloris ethylica TaxID=2743976 RepID=A0ABR9XSA6_9CHLB|nr:SAM-dependent methyltransferase [Prosthecochloris ethylica]MBF0586704.1 SAM-dependent methyltransferase [Prosthecochloris ethylica]MBF0636942.1 SAM-dependent methyltransferase [Prosthecochloris ethylica]NUK47813.1 SAM-dependent methyltransferase [Prosthecochloris ethylica]
MTLHFNTAFLLNSIDAWEQDRRQRFDLASLTESFHESVPALDFIDWKITAVERGYAESLLPLIPNSSNQYIAHQGPLMLLAAEYTGGLALTSLFHLVPIIGFWPSVDNDAGYMWGAKASIKWLTPSCHNLTCKARIEQDKWERLANRFASSNRVVATIPIHMYNSHKLVAVAEFTYWAQDMRGLKRNAFDVEKIDMLYAHKTRTTAKLIVGLRAIEQEKPVGERRFDDPYAFMLAGKHGITLARRFSAATPQLQNMITARTQHLDKAVSAFSQSTDVFNIVNIGAGYDSRFWRLAIDNATIFDLDLPIMLNERKRIFDYSKKPGIHNIDIDLERQTIDTALRQCRYFDPELPTFFIWEGGSMYFEEADIDNILSSVRKLMTPGSRFWLDYVSKDLVQSTTGIREIERFITNIRKMGEPFINGYNDIASLANTYHLSVEENVHSGSALQLDEEIYKHYSFTILREE